MEQSKKNEIVAILLLAVSLLILISLVTFSFDDLELFVSKPNYPLRNFAGIFGAYIGAALFFIMGASSYVIPFLIFTWAVARFYGIKPQKVYFKITGTAFLIIAASSMFSITAGADSTFRFRLGGVVGLVFSDILMKYLGFFGAILVITVLFLLSVLLATEFLFLPFLTKSYKTSRDMFFRIKGKVAETKAPGPIFKAIRPAAEKKPLKPADVHPVDRKLDLDSKDFAVKKLHEPVKVAAEKKEARGDDKLRTTDHGPRTTDAPPKPQLPPYKLPGLDLLDSPPPAEERKIKEDFEANSRMLEETLADFDIEAKVVACNQGPVITRYELQPEAGVKIHRITSLNDNIALAMKAQSVRIVAPIPGKGTIGVEVPNSSSTIVYLKEILSSKEYSGFKSRLKLAIGMDIAGSPVIADLAGMPHLLIAGATGSGKTICVNSIITSLLYSFTPEEIRFIMIDPKRVELAVFNELPHLLCPVVTEAKKVSVALEWVVGEMDSRYELFAKTGVRNIDLYNDKASKNGTAKLPYIVVIIDELADLMMVAQQDIESTITRLAQLSRAVGIHMILATQRPSVDVITGVIKANFPARISFKVASKVDSRTVLDINGADKLLGRGDMLFIEPGASRPIRAQGSLIQDREIERIVSFIKAQRPSDYVEEILAVQKKTQFKKFEKDELYEEAVKVVLETRQASVSMLQRRLGLGYTRAARMIDMMEDDGVVGPYQGSKPREILIASLEEYQKAK